MLEAVDVWFRYPRSDWVMRGIDIELSNGFYCIVGRNGSGKTTLLRIFAGMLRPQKGEISINGRPIKSYRDLVGKAIYLPSNPTAFLVGPRIEDDFQKAGVSDDLIEFFAVRDIARKKIFEASEGERRIATVIAALSYDVDIVLLDEVTVGLDKELRSKLVDILRRFGKRKMVLLATNDFRIIPFCDRILFLEKGRIAEDGPPIGLIGKVPYISRNQTVRIFSVLRQLGLDPELDRRAVLDLLVKCIC